MTKLIARLILAMLILPVSASLFVFGFAAIISQSTGAPSSLSIVLLYLGLYTFVATYWILLWRTMIRWTRERVMRTFLAGVLAVLMSGAAAGFVFMVFRRSEPALVLLISGAIVPVVWVLATVLIWRETPAERIERLSSAGREAISCPVCGYNMTGLSEARCPECGTRFTLDQLVVTQPKTDTHTLPEQ